ncbi:MAG: hypothetical protein ACYTKD_28945 [Planctomycetota bacterium]|jgi:hypothetical protein
MRKALACLVVAALASCFVPQRPAAGATMTLQQGSDGYGGCADTYLKIDWSNLSYENANYGGSQTLQVHREHYLYY